MPSFAYYNVTTAAVTTISAIDTIATPTQFAAIVNIKGSPKSITICNTDASGDDCVIDLYIESQFGTDIIDTGTNANEATNHPTTSSVTLTVDGTAATADVFTGQQVWKSDGTLFGTCTARNSNTEIVFGGGLSQILADNDDLYVGSRYYLLHDAVIADGTTLVLEQGQPQGSLLSYDTTIYALKFVMTTVGSAEKVDIKVEYA